MNDSLGVEALDALIGIGTGGATLLNSLILLDENGTNERYCKAIQKCFIAEGLDQKQNLFLAGTLSGKMIKLLGKLPAKSEGKNKSKEGIESDGNDEFKIAWRYKTASYLDSSIHLKNGIASKCAEEVNKFDLSRTDNIDLKNLRDRFTIFNEYSTQQQPSLSQLWTEIYAQIVKPEYSAANQKDAKKVLRIALTEMTSPLWVDLQNLPLFLAHLKSFVRHTNAIVLISLDSQFIKPSLYTNCLPYVDCAFQLQWMDDREQAKLHLRRRIDGGRFFVHKLPTITSTAPAHVPNVLDLLFSLRKGFFEIKILHLPPAIGDREQQKAANKMTCNSIVEQF